MDSNDQQYWLGFRQGKEKSLLVLYEKYHDDLLRYGLALTADAELSREYINRVFLDLWSRRASLPEVDYPKAYIIACYKNKLIYRKKRKGSLKLVYAEPHEISGQVTEQSYEETVIELQDFEQLKDRLRQVLGSLTERQRTILTKRYLGEMTFEAIAGELEVSVRTIYNSIHESLKQLRSRARGEDTGRRSV